MNMLNEKIKNFLITYKNDFLGLTISTLIFIFLLLFTWQKWGSPVIDCGRELYVGEQILNGTKIYSEIFYNYGPLSPHIMSLIFRVFGIHLNVAYTFGIVTAFCSIICIYLINRQFFKPVVSSLLTITSVYLFFFNPKIHNFIFPYTYSATNGALISFLFLFLMIYIINYNKYKLIPLLGVLCGLNIINKIEYGYTLAILLLVFSLLGYNFYKRINLKYTYTAWGLSILIPLITLGCLVYESGISNLLKFSSYYKLMVSSEPFKFFNYTEMFNMNSIYKNISSIPESLLYLLAIVFVANILVVIFYKTGFKFFIVIFSFMCSLFLGLFYQYFPSWQMTLYTLKINVFSLSAVLCSIITVFYIAKSIKTRNILEKDFNICILTLFFLLVTLRTYLKVDFIGYACYHMPVLITILYYFIFKIFDFCIKRFENIPQLKYHLYASLIILHIVALSNLYAVYTTKNTPIITSRGTIYTFAVTGAALNSLISDINKYTDKSDPIFIAPEEVLVYFLSNRKSVSEFYDYLPLRLVTPELQNDTINILKKKKVKIIAISNRPTFEYIYPFWGINYDQSVFKWIIDNYEPVASYGNYFSIFKGQMTYGINVYTPKKNI